MKLNFKNILFFIGVFVFAFGFLGISNVSAIDTLVSSVYQDTNHDGTVDNVYITMDENVTSCSAMGWLVMMPGGIGITSFSGCTCSGTDAFMNLAITTTAGITGGANPAFFYMPGDTTLASGPMTFKFVAPADGAASAVTKLGDGASDYQLPPSGMGTFEDVLIFTEELDASGKTAVEDALTAGSDVALSFTWGAGLDANKLTITSATVATFDEDVTANVTDLSSNMATDLLLIDSLAPPTLTTDPATSITRTTVSLNGNILDTGGENPTIRFEYGLTNAYGNTTVVGGPFGAGAFSSGVLSLTCGTTYHYRAYATNSEGESNGNDLIFTTSACPRSSSGSYLPGYGPTVQMTLLTPVTNTQTAGSSTPNFQDPIKTVNINLFFGMKNTDVKILQNFLINQNKGPASLALKNHGTTNNFGKLTKSALTEWQKMNNILPSSGYFGPLSRAFIQKM